MELLSEYDYPLPEELIAQTPLLDRAASRLLCLSKDGRIEHRQFAEVVSILKQGDLLVMNDTRVSAVRLLGRKSTGGAVEALLIRETAPSTYQAIVKPGRRLRPGTWIGFEDGIEATVAGDLADGQKLLKFADLDDLAERLERIGLVPLPPYIHTALQDRERYQTVYAASPGSAAAPTAGLHFTPEILSALKELGVDVATVTLDVGIDTFRPVQAEDLSEHKMHGERCTVPPETAEKVRNAKGRIIAVGTTTVRTLESFATGPRQVESGSRESKLFIKPGFEFNVVDGMFTNFHLPRTTMLVMISAMTSRDIIKRAYTEAVFHEYRFLSFGDSMLIL